MVLCNLSIFYAFMSLFTHASIFDTVLSVLICLPAAAWSSNLTHTQGGPLQCIRLCGRHCQGSGHMLLNTAARTGVMLVVQHVQCQYFPNRPHVFTLLRTYDA